MVFDLHAWRTMQNKADRHAADTGQRMSASRMIKELMEAFAYSSLDLDEVIDFIKGNSE